MAQNLQTKIEAKKSDDSLKYLALSETSTSSCFEFQPIDSKTVEVEMKKLKCSKVAGYDKVSVKSSILGLLWT